MFKSKVVAMLKEQLGHDVEVLSVVEQDLLWDGHTEVRAFTRDGVAYSCLCYGETRIGNFVEVPRKPEVQK